MDEFDRIDRFLRPLATHPGALGLLDDVALLEPGAGMQLVLTTDAISQGVHFIGDEPPSEIARKLMRVNLSDLAAKGATPLGYLLTFMLPETIGDAWLQSFCEGLAQDQREFGLSLLGGDSVRTSGSPGFSITAIGEVPGGAAHLRSGAKAGDAAVLTGALGEGAAGLLASRKTLRSISHIDAAHLISRYRLPRPRLATGQAMRGVAHAGMDISDGLMQDLSHMCNASGVGAAIDFDALPVTAGIKKLWLAGDMTTEDIVAGGDDYELLLAVPQAKISALAEIAERTQTPLTVIGEFTVDSSVRLLRGAEEMQLARLGYKHFLG